MTVFASYRKPTREFFKVHLSRYTEPEPAQQVLPERLGLRLPVQPLPRITAHLQAQIT